MSVVGSFTAPFISELAESINFLPITALGLIGGLGLIGIAFFKETLD